MGCNLSVFKKTVDRIVEGLEVPVSLGYKRGSGEFVFTLRWHDTDTDLSVRAFSQRRAHISTEDAGNSAPSGISWEMREKQHRHYANGEWEYPIAGYHVLLSFSDAHTIAVEAMKELLVNRLNQEATRVFPPCNDDIPF